MHLESNKIVRNTVSRGNWSFGGFPFKSIWDLGLTRRLDNITNDTEAFINYFEKAFQDGITPQLMRKYLEERAWISDNDHLSTSYLNLNTLLNTDLESENRVAKETSSIAGMRRSNQFHRVLRDMPNSELTTLVNSSELKRYAPYLIDSYEEAKRHRPEDDEEREFLSKKEVGLKSQYSLLRDGMQILSPNNELIGVTVASYLLPQLESRSDKELLWKRISQAHSKNSPQAADLLQKLTETRNRESALLGYDPLTQKLKDEDIDLATINALSTASKSAIPLRQAIQQRIAKYNGLEKLEPWDYFSESSLIKDISYDDAIRSIASAWNSCDPQLGKYITHMDRNGWVDTSSGIKVSNTQANFQSPIHSFPKVRYDGSIAAFRTLAHELGHALYRLLSNGNEMFTGRTPYYHLNEMVALFSETIGLRELKRSLHIPDDPNPKSLFGGRYNLIHYCLQLHDFEGQVFQEISNGKKLTNTDFDSLYIMTARKWGNNLLIENTHEWVGIPHFFTHPNYVWMYSIGEALANALEQLYDDFTEYKKLIEFGKRLTCMLRAGSSKPSRDLFKDYFDLDISRPEFWEKTFIPLQRKLKEFDEK